jgi:hypothetical protein
LAVVGAGARHRLTTEQSNTLVSLLLEHVGYLHLHGHALATAHHVIRQAYELAHRCRLAAVGQQGALLLWHRKPEWSALVRDAAFYHATCWTRCPVALAAHDMLRRRPI